MSFPLLNIGIDEKTDNSLAKKIRILNGICIYIAILMVFSGTFVMFAFPVPDTISFGKLFEYIVSGHQQRLELVEATYFIYPILDYSVCVFCSLILFLNYRKKFKTAFFVICSYSIFFVCFFILVSSAFNIMMAFVPALLPMFFYNKRKEYLPFLIFLFIIVFVIVYFMYKLDVLYPFFVQRQHAFFTIVINFNILFVMIILIVYHFKSENDRNENLLNLKNNQLLQRAEEIQTQRDEINKQKLDIEQKNLHLRDSINYAKRIQKALLPGKHILNNYFSDSFIFYRPKEIVSGDFYFIRQYEGKMFVIVADCTGHGVPGAFMSILGMTIINELIRQSSSKNASVLLGEMRNMVKLLLNQTGELNEQKDGMDLAIAIIDEKTNNLNFAGARINLLVIRNTEKSEIIELKSNNFPIGVHPKDETPFTDSSLQLEINDVLYLATDGFVSQFHEQTMETFKTRRFKEMLFSIQQESMDNQVEMIGQTLKTWMGNREQIDDILILGMKV